jgi:hypothetical protein
MSDKRRIVVTTGGAIGLGAVAAAFGTCCIAPWAVTLFGVSGAVAFARLSFLQPYVLGSAILLAIVSFWLAYRPRTACAEDACHAAERRRLRVISWVAAGVLAALLIASFAPELLIWSRS